MISLQTFVIGYIAILFIARAFAEIYVYLEERKKPAKPWQRSSEQSSNNAIQNYYNRKGA